MEKELNLTNFGGLVCYFFFGLTYPEDYLLLELIEETFTIIGGF